MRRGIIKKIVFIVIIIIVIIAMVISCINNNDSSFWNLTFGSGISIIIALIISYYFTQKNIDQRHKKEIYLQLLNDFQLLVTDECLFKINKDVDISKLLMKKRKINNSLMTLKQASKDFNLDKDIEFIEEKVTEYVTFLSEHQDDLEYLEKSSKTLERPLDLIEQKICSMKLKMFD